jgi:hypothetical protein
MRPETTNKTGWKKSRTNTPSTPDCPFSLPMVVFVALNFIPNHAPIAANMGHIADHRVRSERMSSALQGQVCPAQHHLPEVIHAMHSQSVRLGIRRVSTSHQRFSYDVEASQLMEQRKRERFSLSTFHREPNNTVVVRTGQSRVVPFEDPEVRPQVVVHGVFHRHVCDRERFLEPRREAMFCNMFDFVCCGYGRDFIKVREEVSNGGWETCCSVVDRCHSHRAGVCQDSGTGRYMGVPGHCKQEIGGEKWKERRGEGGVPCSRISPT